MLYGRAGGHAPHPFVQAQGALWIGLFLCTLVVAVLVSIELDNLVKIKTRNNLPKLYNRSQWLLRPAPRRR